VALRIEHYIVRLQISVANFLFVQKAQHYQHFCHVKSDPLFAASGFQLEIVFVLEDPEEVVPRQVLKDQTNVLVVSKCVVQLNHEVYFGVLLLRVARQQLQDLLFLLDVLNSLLVVDRFFPDPLQCAQLLPHDDQVNRAKLAFSNVNFRVTVQELLLLLLRRLLRIY
jgi:hypothetical protein